jgi:hypothetical protein
MSDQARQQEVCLRYGTTLVPSPSLDKVGVALQTLQLLPLNGLRRAPENGTCGWYIWGGDELSQADDFFQPLHVSHLGDRCPEIVPYLGLPPGYRFLIAPNYEDVWPDNTLLAK